MELIPFDVVYEGWLSEDSMPDSGLLALEVLPLHDNECPWLRNEELEAVRPFAIASRQRQLEQQTTS